VTGGRRGFASLLEADARRGRVPGVDPQKPLPFEGGLLVARPELFDPNFRRTVVFLSSHDEEGTLGFILNRPTGQPLSEFVGDQAELAPLADVPVYLGGPVGTGQLLLAVLEWGAEGRLLLRHNLPVSELVALSGSPAVSVRAFVGHSGWSAGQLDGEMAQGSWLLVKPSRWLIEPPACHGAWHRILRGQGPWFRLMSGMPDHPEWN